MKEKELHIIKKVLQGNTHEYEYFLDRYGKQVFSLIVRIVTSEEDAEELTQDVFMKAFEQLKTFKAESSFSTWIYRIAYNTAISATRKSSRNTLTMDDQYLQQVRDEEVDGLFDSEDEELTDKLYNAMQKLSMEERTLLTLFYYEDKPLAEVAEVMGLTEANVKVRLHRTRKKLYVMIKNETYD